MENPRPEKVAVVEEVRQKLDEADAVVLTEYRGLTVKALAELRTALRAAGGEYKVYKNPWCAVPRPSLSSVSTTISSPVLRRWRSWGTVLTEPLAMQCWWPRPSRSLRRPTPCWC